MIETVKDGVELSAELLDDLSLLYETRYPGENGYL